MRRQLLQTLGALTALALVAGASHARCSRDLYGETVCPEPGARCARAPWGEMACSAPGGDARLDRLQRPVCGAGRCVKDLQGDWQCSTEPWGSAALNRYRQAVCTGACEKPSLERCALRPVPAAGDGPPPPPPAQ